MKFIGKDFVYIFLTLVFLLSSVKVDSTDQSLTSDSLIETLKIPESWSKQTSGVLKRVLSPEKDLVIYFYKEKISTDFDFSKKSLNLWKQIDSSFSYEEKKKTSLSNSKGWDKLTQIVYATPPEESKIIISVLREKDSVAYINLITGSMAAISKRAAQMNIIIEGWKPKSIKDKDYAHVRAKPFKGIIMKYKFNRFVKKIKKELNIPGVAIGIIQDGRVVYKKGFGRTKITEGQPVNSDTLFMIGSMTKPLTTLMMAKLVYEGQLNWDDPTTKPGETFQYSNYLVAAGGFAAAKSYEKTLPLLDSYKKAMNDLVFNPLNMTRTLVINKVPYIENSAFPHSYDFSLKRRCCI